MELQSLTIPATVEPHVAVELPRGNQGTRQVEWPQRKNLGREQRRTSRALSTQQCAYDCPDGKGLWWVCPLDYFALTHRRFLPTQCRALPGAGAATQEQLDLKPLLHSQLCSHTRYLSLLEPCPSQSPDSQDKGLVTGAPRSCSGSLSLARSSPG